MAFFYNSPFVNDSIDIFTQGFLPHWGIGYLSLNDPDLRFHFGGQNQNDMKMCFKIDNLYNSHNRYNVNQEKILEKSNRWKQLKKVKLQKENLDFDLIRIIFLNKKLKNT